MSKLKFNIKAQRVRAAIKGMLTEIGENAVHHFKVKAFDESGFTDTSFSKWKPRKDGDKTRKLLVKTGEMRNSIGIIGRSHNSITIGTGVPYAVYHNEGTERLPKRKFIGESQQLDIKNLKTINRTLRNILSSLSARK